MPQNDEAYFLRRAEQDHELTQRAIDSAVVRVHYRLAEAYLEKFEPVVRAVTNGQIGDS